MSSQPEPKVHLAVGDVTGFWREQSAAFLGIPFAEAPVGDLRFKAPVAVTKLPADFQAKEFGATSQRFPLYAETTIPEPSIMGDSTLNVNVFTPTVTDPDAKLPVLVWIHGGGFIAGSPASPWYDGKAFNASGVVVVTVSYRLGIIGFGPIEGAVANRGLLDLAESLRWVKSNISAFGGDPENVTISGQSAGGALVLDLMAMPSAKGLFQKVISVSPCPPARSNHLAADELDVLAKIAGIENSLNGWSSLSETQLLATQEEFRARDLVGDLSDMANHLLRSAKANEVYIACQPVVDGSVLPVEPIAAFEQRFADDVELIIGCTRDEFVAPAVAAVNLQGSIDFMKAVPAASKTAPAIAAAIASGTTDPMGFVFTQLLFRDTVAATLKARARKGVKTWGYDFNWHSKVSGRAQHCVDLPFAWNLLEADGVVKALGDSPEQSLADALHGDWVSFMKQGSPTWSEFSTSGELRVYEDHGVTVVNDSSLQLFKE